VTGLATQASARRFVLNVLIGFLPAAVLGLLVYKVIKGYLFNAPVVAASFIVGGLIILWAERRAAPRVRIHSVDEMTWVDALKVGLVQCLGMIPGTSRSGSTIIGGMLLGLSRQAATDFSFFLAIPTLVGAGVYSLWKERALLSLADLPLFGVGFFVSFLSAWVCVRWLLPLCGQPHLHPLRLVSHRLRCGGAAHRLDRLGGVGRLNDDGASGKMPAVHRRHHDRRHRAARRAAHRR
jgi:undecaprenyl-diphosphatase